MTSTSFHLLRSATATATAMALAASAPAWANRPIAFYAPWDVESAASLRDHAEKLSVVVPAWFSVTGNDHAVTVTPDPVGHATLDALRHRPELWLMAQNASLGSWDGAGAASLVHDPAASKMMLDRLVAEVVKEKASGIVIDFEALPEGAQPDLISFLGRAHAITLAHHWTLAVTAPVVNAGWDLAAIGATTDRVILMAYDEHWQTGATGPIASDAWFRSVVAKAVSQLPHAHAIVGIASYAYDWPPAGAAAILSIARARDIATEYSSPLVVDGSSGATHFSYTLGGNAHRVWMSDARTVKRQTLLARKAGAGDVALWRLGTEDPGIWTDGRSSDR